VLNKIRIGLFVALFAGANLVFAEVTKSCPPAAIQPTPETIQAAMRSASDHGFLWRISKDSHTSYLYGTIHVAKFDWMFPGPVVNQALRASDTIALELDMLDPDIQVQLSKGIAQFPETALPEALSKRMRQQADAVCVPYNSITNFAPVFQIDTLTLMVGSWDGLYAAYGIDSVLAGIGHSAKKTVVSLETPQLQLQLLQMKDSQETISLVQDSLDELESGRAHIFLNRIAKIWEKADYDEMSHFNEWCECLDTVIEREMMRRLLDDRNPNLAERIDAIHKSGKTVFAAVGSLHMFGPIGLPALMQKHGYRVERVDLQSK